MSQRAAFPIFAIVLSACSVTVVQPPTQAPAPQPAPVVVQQAPQPAPPAPPAPPADMPDPPSRVGRLGLVVGTVSFRSADADAWWPAEPNRPVASGDRIWTDADARAELDVGSLVFRVGAQSELDIVQLDDHTVQVRLPQGELIERVMGDNGEVHEIDAPNAAVSIEQPGLYRVDVSPDGQATTVTVIAGQATVSEAGSSFAVNARQRATVLGSSDAPTFRLADATSPDGFDQWSHERDAYLDRVMAGPRYVPADMPGAADLAANGRWEMDPALGAVWYPAGVPAGWAPYRTGHWVWVHPWGWTWLDDASWGYAPYHYGRWAYRNGAWGWCPGRTVTTPVYAPALVVFVNAAPATVAWVPLGPGEPYQPAFGSASYRARFDASQPGAVAYRNQSVPSAVTVVNQQTFVNAKPVAPNLVVGARRISGVLGAAPPAEVVHTRASVAPVAARAVEPPPAVFARTVIAMRAPPASRADVVMVPQHAHAAQPGQPAQTVQPGRLTPSERGTVWHPVAASPQLDADYKQRKTELEERQRDEVAHPKAGENAEMRDARHEQERRDLDATYDKARASGATALPRAEAAPQH
jgi:hypothetical protein